MPPADEADEPYNRKFQPDVNLATGFPFTLLKPLTPEITPEYDILNAVP
jgi:hypothetical protein